MHAKYCVGALAAIGLTCAAGVDLPARLSPLAGVAFAKSHGHSRHHAHATHRKRSEARRSSKPDRVAAVPRPVARPAEPVAPVNEEERRAKLQHALETRAQELAVARSSETTGSLSQVALAQRSAGVAPPTSQPRSVSFDFESGLKTTLYPGDLVVREGFDVAAAKSLAATPPNETILARAKP